MIRYELAKELKDAGFPQGGPKEPHCVQCNELALYTRCYDHEKEYVFHPTLSELIEACGETLQSLYNCGSAGWEAIREDDKYGDSKGFEKGSTPEEAVARLWLALNPKKI